MNQQLLTLKDKLQDWTDIDVAQYYLGQSLGIFDEEYRKYKEVFWSNNPLCNMLSRMLDELHAVQILDKRDEPDFQYRWNADFVGDWEN